MYFQTYTADFIQELVCYEPLISSPMKVRWGRNLLNSCFKVAVVLMEAGGVPAIATKHQMWVYQDFDRGMFVLYCALLSYCFVIVWFTALIIQFFAA